MDSRTASSILRTALPHARIRSFTRPVSILAAAVVLASLIVARELFGVPTPLVITLAVSFLSWWTVTAALPCLGESATVRYLAYLLLPWGILSTSFLWGVYRIDHGGWLWFQVSGYNEAIPEDRIWDVDLTAAEFVHRHPAFVLNRQDPTRIVLPAGEHVFETTVVVPKGTALTIEPGTVVRMGSGCSLVSYSPVIARGTPNQPIAFKARYSWLKWGVIGVVHRGRTVFEYVRFENARQAEINEIDFPGGLSLIDAQAEVRRCHFVNMFGKDAVYVRGGEATIRDNRVDWAFKDGIDIDRASGEILGNLLVDCDDEGIDLSDDAKVTVRDNTVRDRHGGRIAASHDLASIRAHNTMEYSLRD